MKMLVAAAGTVGQMLHASVSLSSRVAFYSVFSARVTRYSASRGRRRLFRTPRDVCRCTVYGLGFNIRPLLIISGFAH